MRNWLFVEDFGRAIGHVLEHGEPGETYNCGGPDECENLEVVQADPVVDRRRSVADRVRDRPARARPPLLALVREAQALGWRARTRFEDGLALTVDWYRENAWWWEAIRSGAYREYYERHYGRALKA